MTEASTLDTAPTFPGVPEASALYLVPEVEEVLPIPTLAEIQARYYEGGIGDYRILVESLRISDSAQYAIVEKIRETQQALAEHTDSVETVEAVMQAVAELRQQLVVGNLASVLDVVSALKGGGHRTSLLKLLLEGNRLAQQWFKRQYGSLKRTEKAPAYPTDILCVDYIRPKLAKYKGITKKKPKVTDAPKTADLTSEAVVVNG